MYNITKQNDLLQANSQDVSFELDTPAKGLFTLKANGFRVQAQPALVGEFPETLAISGKRRPHSATTSDEISFETESTIPFGVKNTIAREYLLDGRALQTVTIFQLPHALELKHLFAGGLVFSGKFRTVAVTPVPETPGLLTNPEEQPFADLPDSECIFKSAIPPLRIAIRNDAGELLEFRLGDDIWRWCNAEKLGGKSEYTIRRKGETLEFGWLLHDFKATEQTPAPCGRNWQISWSLFFAEEDTFQGEPKAVFSWTESGLAEPVCFCAPAVLNAMKKWVRAQLPVAEEGDVFLIPRRTPGVCDNASHLLRAKQKNLLHWDLPAEYDFQRWANRQLQAKGARLIFAD